MFVVLRVATGSISDNTGSRRRAGLTGVLKATSWPEDNTQSEGKKQTEGNNWIVKWIINLKGTKTSNNQASSFWTYPFPWCQQQQLASVVGHQAAVASSW